VSYVLPVIDPEPLGLSAAVKVRTDWEETADRVEATVHEYDEKYSPMDPLDMLRWTVELSRNQASPKERE
jgi:hypothetical protein